MKLKFIKKYSYKVPKEIYNKTYNQTNVITNFNVLDNYYLFHTNTKIDVFNEYEDNNYKRILKKFVIPHLVLIISFIAIIFCFITSPNIIRKIEFKKNSIKDAVILNDLISLIEQDQSLNINEISNKLMIKYPHYSWIGLEREGSLLLLNIQISDVSEQKFIKDTLSGDLVSKYDAYITHIEVKQGHLVTGINKIVKKGQLLISGNLNYDKNQSNDLFVTPQGIVLGEVIERYTFRINKYNTSKIMTGNVNKKKLFKFNNYEINKSIKKYSDSIIIKQNKFSLLGFKIIESIEYEMGNEQFIYDDESIVQYILSLIHYNLEKNRVHDLEKVINYNILNLIEKNGVYTVTIITRELKNIVLFQENA